MSKPDWKTKPHERKRMTLQQENQKLKERIERLVVERDEYREQYKAARAHREDINKNADRYLALRNKDVMVLDGEPKYVKGADLDAYCDAESEKFWGASMSSMMANIHKKINGGAPLGSGANKMIVPLSHLKMAQQIFKEELDGHDARSKSKEADSKDSGHYTDVLRYADWYGLWKQRRS